MSERRKKRANQKRSESLRRLQAREGTPKLQTDNQPVPEQEGQSLAETDTTNRETGGQPMYRESFMDRIKEHKSTIIQIGVVVGIAIVVSAIMLLLMAPGKGDLAKLKDETETSIAMASAQFTSVRADVDDILALGALATTSDLAGVIDETTELGSDVSELKARQNLDHAELLALNATVAALPSGSPKGYLTGVCGNYTLHAAASESGNYTANVNLVYLPPVWVGGGNETIEDVLLELSPTLNWVTPATAYNGTHWAVTSVSFNIGVFELAANTEATIPVVFGATNSTYVPSFAYVEVYPVLR